MENSVVTGEKAPNPFLRLGTYLKEHRRDYAFLFLIGAALISLDQWTKALVRANIPVGSDWLPDSLGWLMPYLRVRHWHNIGTAFGLFQYELVNTIVSILAVVIALVIVYYFPRASRRDWWIRLALALQFSGAIGNLIDRLRFGQVTDFISVGSFAIFNVADSCISVGVAILVVGVWLKERAEKKRAAARTDEAKGE